MINLKKRGRKLYRNNDSNIYDSSKEAFFYKGRNRATLREASKSEPFTPVYTVPISLAREKKKKTEGKENFLKTRYTNNTQALSFPRKSFEKYRTSHEREIKRMLS